MRLKNNEIAACLVIALGVGSVLTGAMLQEISTGKAAQQQPESVAAAAYVEPTPAPETTPEPMPTVETVRFSATGDDLIHDGIFLQAKNRGTDGYYDFSYAYENMRDFYTQFDVNWLNQETLVNDAFDPSGYPMFSTPGDITDALYDIGFRVFSLSNNTATIKVRRASMPPASIGPRCPMTWFRWGSTTWKPMTTTCTRR